MTSGATAGIAEASGGVGSQPGWEPSDFILRGEYCPRACAYAGVEEARLHAGASAALVIAADEEALLRSLCFQAPKTLGSPTDLVGLLRGSSDLNSVGLRTFTLTSGAVGDASHFPWSAKRLLSELESFARGGGYGAMADWLSPSANWVPARIPGAARTARISAAVLFLDPTEHLSEDETGLEVVDADRHVVDITERINATAQADVRRDAAIMARLDNRLDPADYVTRTIDFKQAAKSLVALAREISGSDVGACYVFDHGVDAMRLEAHDLPGDRARLWRYEEELPLDSDELVLNCYLSRRPIQLPPGPPDAKTPAMTCCGSDGKRLEQGPWVELATPIVGPLASPKARAVGVLTVTRLTSDLPYGAYDLALMRNIALRLSLISATTNSEEAARTFTRLSSHRIARRGSQSTSIVPEGQSGAGLAKAEVVGKPLPEDLETTLPAITEGLQTLGRVTGSHSATFRAALPGEETERAHGLVLRRIAAHPRHWMKDGNEIQTAEEGGINWRVALEGRPYYAPIVASAKGYLSKREKTVAELSVPVFVQGRVIGTVNLESADRNAYDAQVATAHAFAAHVGLAIADARIAIASVLHDYATKIVSRGHEIGGECKELRAISSELEPNHTKRIWEIANAVERKVKGLREFERSAPDPEVGRTLPDLVDEQIRKIELRKVKIDRNPKDVWGLHAPAVTDVIEEALKDIFHNVNRHSPTDGERARMELRRGRWGGRLQDLLIIHNRASECLNPRREANVFRVPLVRSLGDGGRAGAGGTQVPQLGAYLAGTLIRGVGGEVHLTHGPDEQTRIVVSVPATNPRESKGETVE